MPTFRNWNTTMEDTNAPNLAPRLWNPTERDRMKEGMIEQDKDSMIELRLVITYLTITSPYI